MTDEERLKRYDELRETGRLIELDYPIFPEPRYGWGKPVHAGLHRLISTSDARYAAALEGFSAYRENFLRIDAEPDDGPEPRWINPAMPVADAMSLYTYTATRNPRLFVEIGSGNSTRFVRRAIRDHNLRTKIISFEPWPPAYLPQICDELISTPLEKASLDIFDTLTSEDIVFCDNSHRAFQNSDATVFFLDVLPRLAGGPLVGIHDIFLPHDYQPRWASWFFNEQYLLACYLLGGDAVNIELPLFHCLQTPELAAKLDPLWSDKLFDNAIKKGGAFWLTLSKR